MQAHRTTVGKARDETWAVTGPGHSLAAVLAVFGLVSLEGAKCSQWYKAANALAANT